MPPTTDDHSRAPVVIISLVVFGGLAVGCGGAIALGLLGRARGWW